MAAGGVHGVALRGRAWIEMSKRLIAPYSMVVALRGRAWIEM